MKKNDQFINEDTYQTLTEIKTDSQPYEKAIAPLWKKKNNKKEIASNKIRFFTPDFFLRTNFFLNKTCCRFIILTFFFCLFVGLNRFLSIILEFKRISFNFLVNFKKTIL